MDWSGITASILGAHGDAATYGYGSGGSSAITVVISEGVDVIDESGQIIDRVKAATIQKSLLSYTPRQGDYITVGTARYDVQRILSDDGFAVQVSVTT